MLWLQSKRRASSRWRRQRASLSLSQRHTSHLEVTQAMTLSSAHTKHTTWSIYVKSEAFLRLDEREHITDR